MGFEEFYSINAGKSDNRLIHAIVEWWWLSTHTFHFPCGKLGFTPLDFVMLTGISFGKGRELLYDERYSKLEEAEKMFPGIKSSDMRNGNITLNYLKKWKEPLNPCLHNYDSEMDIVYAQEFIAYMMSNLLFSNGTTSLRAGYLVDLTNYDILGTLGFDWGMPIMAALYRGLDEVSVLREGKVKKSITGFYAVLEFWFFEYCRVGMYLVKVHNFNHVYPRISGCRDERASTGSEIHHSFAVIRDMIEWKDRTNIDWQPWHRSKQLIYSEVRVASVLSTQTVLLVSVSYAHGTLWYLGDWCMCQMTGSDSVPYDPPQEIMEFPRYDRKIYQSLKDEDFYDGRDYLVIDVDYMINWHTIHSNPKIGYSLVKRRGNIWSVGHDLVRPDIILPPTLSLAMSSQVQDYGVQATDDPRDMGWFMDMAGPNDQRRWILIPVIQVPYPCPPTYSTDEL
ncbi:hypothetical protein GIB67_016647 [Kingdonia uniflora]|uniref:Aminotransferase-like plant mobile domain-containing protein n=1 Tax=Kingdonia uniflora TaxID=39325 RepID=A0A7J7MZ52_9MAGN|nr:hypothetical protein GIB67_016647 [Kingdonia uniflora]